MRDWRFSDLRDWLAIHAPLTRLSDGELQCSREDQDRQMMDNLRLRYRWADLALIVRQEQQQVAENDLPEIDLPVGTKISQKERLVLRWLRQLLQTEKKSPSIRDLTVRLGYRSPRSVHLIIARLIKLGLIERMKTGELRLKDVEWSQQQPPDKMISLPPGLELPDWAEWVARDQRGECHLFEHRPICLAHGIWVESPDRPGRATNLVDGRWVPKADWWTSLRQIVR